MSNEEKKIILKASAIAVNECIRKNSVGTFDKKSGKLIEWMDVLIGLAEMLDELKEDK